MATFDKCIPIILEHEGGAKYTNNPKDPGGSTKYGISLLFLSKLSLAFGDIDHDGDIDAEDIKALSESYAEELYLDYFWKPLNLDGITNDLLSLHIFDHGVNAGTKTAVRLVQRIVKVNDDGSLGNISKAAINNYSGNIVGEYINARKEYYNSIIAKNHDLSVFLQGWFNRIQNTHF